MSLQPATGDAPRRRLALEALLLLHFAALVALYLETNLHLQPALTPDMGRDLFAYARMANGEVPYADFH